MNKIQITLGQETNVAEVLLNRMVGSNMTLEHMVIVVSSLIHSCDKGSRLDEFDKSLLRSIGYHNFAIINTLDDYHAMNALEKYLDEELPLVLSELKSKSEVMTCHFQRPLGNLGFEGISHRKLLEI